MKVQETSSLELASVLGDLCRRGQGSSWTTVPQVALGGGKSFVTPGPHEAGIPTPAPPLALSMADSTG